MKRKTQAVEMAGQETHYFRELGGRVSVRGLSVDQIAVARQGIAHLPEKERRAAMAIAMLIGGITYPKQDPESATKLVRQHTEVALYLLDRIRMLTEQRLREVGILA